MVTASEKALAEVLTAQDNKSACGTLPFKESLMEEDVPRDLFVFPVPKHLRHNPTEEVRFSLGLNILFAVATIFSTPNSSYDHTFTCISDPTSC